MSGHIAAGRSAADRIAAVRWWLLGWLCGCGLIALGGGAVQAQANLTEQPDSAAGQVPAAVLLGPEVPLGPQPPAPPDGKTGLVAAPFAATPVVVGGEVDKGHKAVGLFHTKTRPASATLVGKRTVLTAAHCIDADFRHVFELDGVAYEVEAVEKHPHYREAADPESRANPLRLADHDLAVVRLKQAPPITPAVLNSQPLERPLRITIVGLGESALERNDRGQRRVAFNTIAELTETKFRYNGTGSVCHGDSGGPTFAVLGDQEVLIGVHSVVSNPCGPFGVDIRVDAYLEWIKRAAQGDVVIGPTRKQ